MLDGEPNLTASHQFQSAKILNYFYFNIFFLHLSRWIFFGGGLSFVCVIGLFVLNYLSYGWTSYNVAGLGQLARIDEMDQSMLAMVVTGAVCVVTLFFLISCSYKKYFVGR